MLVEEWLTQLDAAALGKAALLGLVEGATEFIPVSSTGHLILVQNWIGFTGAKENAFLIFIQLGAILAVVWLYREKFAQVIRNLHKDPAARQLVVNLVIGTLPAVVIGLPTDDWIEAHLFRPFPVAVALVVGGVAILVIERTRRPARIGSVDDLPLSVAFWIGVFQVLAILFPGMSRSGATILGGLVLGLSRTAAAEFSFFLAIPAMFGASLVKLGGVYDDVTAADIPLFGLGFIVAFFAALAAVKALVAFVSRHSFTPFAWYRIVLGTVIVLLYVTDFVAF
jgi:undecaprenyl-diphosphatase